MKKLALSLLLISILSPRQSFAVCSEIGMLLEHSQDYFKQLRTELIENDDGWKFYGSKLMLPNASECVVDSEFEGSNDHTAGHTCRWYYAVSDKDEMQKAYQGMYAAMKQCFSSIKMTEKYEIEMTEDYEDGDEKTIKWYVGDSGVSLGTRVTEKRGSLRMTVYTAPK